MPTKQSASLPLSKIKKLNATSENKPSCPGMKCATSPPQKVVNTLKSPGKKIAVVVGEDIRTEQQYGEYTDIIVNLCNSTYSRGIVEKRYDFYRQLAFMTGKPIVYVNNVGGQTDVICDGSSAFINSRGEAIALLKVLKRIFRSSTATPITNRSSSRSRTRPLMSLRQLNWDWKITSPKTVSKKPVWGCRAESIRLSFYPWL